MTAPTILFLTSDLQDLDILNREASRTGALAFAPCPSPALVAEQLERDACLGLLVDSTLPAAARREAIEGVRRAQPSLPVVALVAPGDGESALAAGATAFIHKRGAFAPRVVALFSAVLESGAGAGTLDPGAVQVLAFGLTPAQTAALDRAGWTPYAATVNAEGVHLRDGTMVDPAGFDGAVISEAGMQQQACDLLVDVRGRAPYLTLVALTSGRDVTFGVAAERLGGVSVTAADDGLAAMLERLVPLLHARRHAVDELLVARASELRVRAVIECAPSSIVLLDADGTCLAMNWAGLSVLGHSDARNVVGLDFGQCVAPEDATAFAELLRVVTGGTPHAITVSCRTATSDMAKVHITGVPLPRETPDSFGVLCTMAAAPPETASQDVDGLIAAEAERFTHEIERLTLERDHYAERALELERECAARASEGERIDVATAAAHAEEAVRLAALDWEAAHEAAIGTLRAELQGELQGERDAARQSADVSAETIAALRSQVAEAADLRQRCDLLETWLHEAEARCDDLQRELASRPTDVPIDRTEEVEQLRAALAQAESAAELARMEADDAGLRAAHAHELLGETERALGRERELANVLGEAAQRADQLEREMAEGLLAQESLATEIARLRADHEGLGTHVSTLEEELAIARVALDHERRQLISERAQREDLDDLVTTLRAALDEEKADLDGHDGPVSDLTAERNALDERLAAAAALEGELRRQVDALVEERHHAGEQQRGLEESVAALSRQREEMEHALSAARAQLLASEEALADTKADLGMAWESESGARMARDESAAALAHARQELDRLALQYQVAVAEGAATKARLESIDEELRSARFAVEGADASLAAERTERERMEQAISAVRDELETVVAERDRVAALHIGVTAELANVTTELAALSASTAEARHESAALASSHRQAVEALAEAEAKMARLVKERQEAAVRVEALEAQLAEALGLAATTSSLTARIADLEQDLSEAIGRANVAAADLITTRAERDDLIGERDALSAERRRLADECERLERAERMAHASAAQHEAQAQELRRQLDAAIIAADTWQARLDTAQDEALALRASLTAEQQARRDDAVEHAEQQARLADTQRLQTELAHSLAQLAEQRQQLDEYRDLHAALESGLRSAEATLDQLADTQRHERAQTHLQRKELDRTRQALRDRERELQRAKSLANSVKERLERERAAARAEATTRRSAEQAAETRVRDLERELDHLQRTIDGLEGRLRDREAHWARFWTNAPVGLATTTVDGRVLTCNPELASWLGDDHDRLQGRARQLPPVALDAGDSVTREIGLRGVAGVRQVLEHATCRRDREQLVVERTLIDVSRMHALMSELREARRFESVGRLTVRMVDDLCGVVDRLDALARQSDRRGPSFGRGSLAELPEATSRALALVRQLQQHARRQLRNEPEFAVVGAVHALLPVLQRVTGDDIDWHVDEVDDAMLGVERHAFEHLLTALALSAREALPEGGTATLSLASRAETSPESEYGVRPVLILTAEGYGLSQVSEEATRSAALRCGGALRLETSARACRWLVTFGDAQQASPRPVRSPRAS